MKQIIALIFSPIIYLMNVFFNAGKNYIVKYTFNFSAVCYIESDPDNDNISSNILITSYLLFLARFFYICDERQFIPISNFMISRLSGDDNYDEFSNEIYDVIYNTLNDQEKSAVHGLFFLGVPPIYYSNEKSDARYGKYEFRINGTDGGYGHVFIMSPGADVILLPLTLGLFYQYIYDKLNHNDKLIFIKKVSKYLESLFIDDRNDLSRLTILANKTSKLI